MDSSLTPHCRLRTCQVVLTSMAADGHLSATVGAAAGAGAVRWRAACWSRGWPSAGAATRLGARGLRPASGGWGMRTEGTRAGSSRQPSPRDGTG